MASFIKGKHLSIYTIFPTNSLYNISCSCLKSLTCVKVNPESMSYYENIVQNFVATYTSTRHFPTLQRKSKIHLLLLLPEHMRMFGPTSYNTERFVDFHVKILILRCESYNLLIRCRNIYSNRQAPSKDIANSFAIQESIRFAFAERIAIPLLKRLQTFSLNYLHIHVFFTS